MLFRICYVPLNFFSNLFPSPAFSPKILNIMKKYSYLFFLSMLLMIACKDLEELIHPPVAKEATDVCSEGFTANWESKFDCKKFLLYVSEDADFDSYLPGYDGKEVEGNSHEVNGLEPEQTYYYKVRAKIHDKLSDYSNIIEVKTLDYCLSAPVALSCKDLVFDSFTAQWDAVEGAEKYVLEVAYDKDFKNYVEGYERRVTSELHKPVYILDENTKYYYRVRAVKGKTWSRYSNVVECKTSKNPFLLEKVTFSPSDDRTHIMEGTYNEKDQLVKIEYKIYYSATAETNLISTYQYYYDEENRLKRLEYDNDFYFDFYYDQQDRVEKISTNTGHILYEYIYHDDNSFTEHWYTQKTYTQVYTLDEYGNIIKIKYLRGEATFTRTFKYAFKTRAPKNFNLFISGRFDTFIIENAFQEWFYNPFNVVGDDTDVAEYGYTYNEYTFNECGFPLSKRLYYYSEKYGLEDYGEIKYYYKGNPSCDALTQ
jgi:hypothetical protein